MHPPSSRRAAFVFGAVAGMLGTLLILVGIVVLNRHLASRGGASSPSSVATSTSTSTPTPTAADASPDLEGDRGLRWVDLDVDLDGDGLAGNEPDHERLEDEAGGLVLLNADDDDGDGDSRRSGDDRRQGGRVAHEDDLLAATLWVHPRERAASEATLRHVRLTLVGVQDAELGKIGLWAEPGHAGFLLGNTLQGSIKVRTTSASWPLYMTPARIWIEGVRRSDAPRDVTLEMQLTDWKGNPIGDPDTVRLSVAAAQLELTPPASQLDHPQRVRPLTASLKQSPGSPLLPHVGPPAIVEVAPTGVDGLMRVVHYPHDKLLVADTDGRPIESGETLTSDGNAPDAPQTHLHIWRKPGFTPGETHSFTLALSDTTGTFPNAARFTESVTFHDGVVDILEVPKFQFAYVPFATPIRFAVYHDAMLPHAPSDVHVDKVRVRLLDRGGEERPLIDMTFDGERFGPGDGTDKPDADTFAGEWTVFIPRPGFPRPLAPLRANPGCRLGHGGVVHPPLGARPDRRGTGAIGAERPARPPRVRGGQERRRGRARSQLGPRSVQIRSAEPPLPRAAAT